MAVDAALAAVKERERALEAEAREAAAEAARKQGQQAVRKPPSGREVRPLHRCLGPDTFHTPPSEVLRICFVWKYLR